MLAWLGNRSFGAKLATSVVLTVLGLLLLTGCAVLISRGQIVAGRKTQIRSVIEAVVSYANGLEDDVASGRLSRGEAIDRFVKLTTPLQYGEGGYIFAVSLQDGRYIMHGSKPALAGTDAASVVDPKGRHHVQDAMAIAKRDGAGYYPLSYPRPGSTVATDKLNYVKAIPAWNMMVATGVYIDDVDAIVMHEAELLGLVALPTILLCAGFGLLMRQSIVGGLRRLSGVLTRLGHGELSGSIPGDGRGDELGVMARSVGVLQQSLLQARENAAQAACAAEEAQVMQDQAVAERAQAAAQLAMVVEQLASGLAELSSGNLVCALQTPFADQYEPLRNDFNRSVRQLRGTITRVVENTRLIAAGTVEMSTAADNLSRRTEQQAASLEQTAAALDEVTATVHKTAENARLARGAADTAQSSARKSSQVINEAVTAMAAIQTSAGQISQITGVIDEIAFQTNLLALNAGVEAARAGDAGRGFAVVASEVRALAQRSAAAAKEIKQLISTSAAQVGQGVNLVGATGEVLSGIVMQVDQINRLIVEIAASAQEQSAGLAEVNGAVNQMDQMTQQNVAMVEQSTAACHNLAQEAAELSHLTEQFSTAETLAG